MRTLILSDLHLGGLTGTDLLRWPAVREKLFAALDGVERLVLLGDVLELRHGPARDALAASRAFFEDLGDHLGGARELVLVAGNHDHGLVEPWLARRGEEVAPEPLALQQLLEAGEVSRAYERIAAWAAPARVLVAYPGLWLRDDVYATHGHYLDSHLTIPTLERLTVGAMARLIGSRPDTFARVDDYEDVGAPMFAWRDVVARETRTGSMLNGLATVGAWRALGGAGGDGPTGARSGRDAHGSSNHDGARPLTRAAGATGRRARRARVLASVRRRALVAAFPLAVAALNRAGLGPLKAEVSGSELRRAGLLAMGEAAARLGLKDAWVVFGHTHRPGPLPGDEAAEWRGRGGARLVNAGSWTYSSVFLRASAKESPYWPGGAVLVEESGPPQVLRLLQDVGREELQQLKARPLQADLS